MRLTSRTLITIVLATIAAIALGKPAASGQDNGLAAGFMALAAKMAMAAANAMSSAYSDLVVAPAVPDRDQLQFLHSFIARSIELSTWQDPGYMHDLIEHVRADGPRALVLAANPQLYERIVARSPLLAKYAGSTIAFVDAMLPEGFKLKRKLFSLASQQQDIAVYLSQRDRTDLERQLGQYVAQLHDVIAVTDLSPLVDMKDVMMSLKGTDDLAMVVEFIRSYPDAIGVEGKLKLIAAYFRAPLDATPADRLVRSISACGTVMHKIVQTISAKSSDRGIRKALLQIKSHITPEHPSSIRSVLSRAIGDDWTDVLVDFSFEPLASASIGQVHATKFRNDDGDVVDAVVKVKRAHLHEGLASESGAVDRIGERYPEARALLTPFQQSLQRELDWSTEVEAMEQARRAYSNKHPNVFVTELYGAFPEGDPELIIQGKAEGIDVAELGAHRLPRAAICKAAELLPAVYEVWLEEILFGGRFFHGDLHGGNLKYHWNRQSPLDSKMTILDMGNTHVLDDASFRMVAKVVLGVRSVDPDLVLSGLLADAERFDAATIAEVREGIARWMSEQIDECKARANVGCTPSLDAKFLSVIRKVQDRSNDALVELMKAKIHIQNMFDDLGRLLVKKKATCVMTTSGEVFAKVVRNRAWSSVAILSQLGLTSAMSVASIASRNAANSIVAYLPFVA